ncbi:MAG TPA: hypothetical protein DCE56_29560 [Cyanobacteria bacterium UBA8553]|nr:hypothetical protein [Cyanobacteria bacterium UBA8553]
MQPLLKKDYLCNALILILIGAGIYFFIDQAIEKTLEGRLKNLFEYLGYLSAPIGLISYFLKEVNLKNESLQKELKELRESTFVEISQLKIMAEFSYRFGQQAADIQNLKEQVKRLKEYE